MAAGLFARKGDSSPSCSTIAILGMNGDASSYSTGVCEIHAELYHLYFIQPMTPSKDMLVLVKAPLWNCVISFELVIIIPSVYWRAQMSAEALYQQQV